MRLPVSISRGKTPWLRPVEALEPHASARMLGYALACLRGRVTPYEGEFPTGGEAACRAREPAIAG